MHTPYQDYKEDYENGIAHYSNTKKAVKVNPITPDECDMDVTIPEFVFEAFNELIREGYNARSSKVSRSAVVNLIKTKMPELMEFKQYWLNIEKHYAKSGWDVTCDSPDYPAYYWFTRHDASNDKD